MKSLSTRVCIETMAMIRMVGLPFDALAEEMTRNRIIERGKMCASIGMKQDQGRERIDAVLRRKQFYAIAALE